MLETRMRYTYGEASVLTRRLQCWLGLLLSIYQYIHAILLISVYIDIPTQSGYLLKLHSLASLALYVSSYSTYVYFEAGGEGEPKYEEFR